MAIIDIVIPVYNQAEKLIKCLKCLQKQTFQDFLIIIVNDGSTDNLEIMLESWLRSENLRAKDIRNEISTKTKILYQNHLGASSARNRGAKEGKSKYILFCDADLQLQNNFLQKMYNLLNNNIQYSYCYSSFKYGWKKFKLWKFDEEKLKKIPYIHTTSLIRKMDFPGFDENLKRFQDWDLWLTMLEQGKKGIWIPEYLFKVRSRGTMSKWVPKFMYQYFKKSKKVDEYNKAMGIIKSKHHLLLFFL